MGLIISRRRNKKYSAEIKLQAVEAHLNGVGSYVAVSQKYGLRSKTQLENWVLWYNGHKVFKELRGAGTEIYMTKGRKTKTETRLTFKFCVNTP